MIIKHIFGPVLCRIKKRLQNVNYGNYATGYYAVSESN